MKKLALLFSLTLFTACFTISALIPPFQSPDEFDHVKRAYLLTQGQIFLETPEGQSSGGMIDSGLFSYFIPYNEILARRDSKIHFDREYDDIRWTGQKEFRQAPCYFPFIYAPQAAGLFIGQILGLSVATSYLLAKITALAISCLIIFYAFSIYSPPPLAAGLLLIPMTMFQMASASLDGISTAISILALSLFMRIAVDKEKSKPWFLYALCLCVILVATTRTHLLTMIFLVFATFLYTKNKRSLIAGFVVTTFVALWTIYSLTGVVDKRVIRDVSTSSIISYYAQDPISLLRVIIQTLKNSDNLRFYAESFVGILGWLDARFSASVYVSLYFLLFALVLSSVSFKAFKSQWRERVLLLCCAIGSFFFIFFALLIGWNPHPAVIIGGVQGRYFLVPAIMLAYSIDSATRIKSQAFHYAGILLLIALLLLSSFTTTKLLLSRYYISSPNS